MEAAAATEALRLETELTADEPDLDDLVDLAEDLVDLMDLVDRVDRGTDLFCSEDPAICVALNLTSEKKGLRPRGVRPLSREFFPPRVVVP
jgi:hypothetical protein